MTLAVCQSSLWWPWSVHCSSMGRRGLVASEPTIKFTCSLGACIKNVLSTLIFENKTGQRKRRAEWSRNLIMMKQGQASDNTYKEPNPCMTTGRSAANETFAYFTPSWLFTNALLHPDVLFLVKWILATLRNCSESVISFYKPPQNLIIAFCQRTIWKSNSRLWRKKRKIPQVHIWIRL